MDFSVKAAFSLTADARGNLPTEFRCLNSSLCVGEAACLEVAWVPAKYNGGPHHQCQDDLEGAGDASHTSHRQDLQFRG